MVSLGHNELISRNNMIVPGSGYLHQAITWTNDNYLLTGPIGINKL